MENEKHRIKSLPSKDEEKKKRKKRFILLFIVIGFFLFAGVTAGVVVKIQHTNISTTYTKLDVVVDPIIVSNDLENHINGAQRFVFGEDSQTTYSTHIETQLSYVQYIYYSYTLKNQGKTDVGIKLDLELEENLNANITYCINDGEIVVASEKLLDFVSSPDSITNLKLFVKIDDPNQDAYVKGVLILSLNEEGADNE